MLDVGFASIFFVLMVSTTAVQSQITKGPGNALKKVDDSVTLECVTSSRNCDRVEWTKMEGAQTPLTVYKHDIGTLNGFKERYNVSSTGGCSLTITQLQISDSGRFSCVVTVDADEVKRSSILVVINPVESIAVSAGPYYKNGTVRCTADGYPFPTFKWTHLKSGAVVDDYTLVINGETEDKYTCTATNAVKGKTTSLNITIEVVSPPESGPDPGCGPGCIGGIVGGIVAIVVAGVISFFVYKRVSATS